MPSSRKCQPEKLKKNPPVSLQEKRKRGQMQKRHDEKSEKWNERFKELLDFRSEHFDCDIPVSQGKLGLWVSTQHQAYMTGSLAQGRINRLNSIGFKWRQTED